MKKLVKKPVFKKNQMIITALAGMIAIAGYLNYAGTDVNPSLLSVDSEAVEDVAETDLAQDISAEDTYALTEVRILRVLMKMRTEMWQSKKVRMPGRP